MDGEKNGKPYLLMDDLGGKTHYFRKHPYEQSENPEVLDAFVMVQWNTECLQDEFYVENRQIFHFHDYGKKGIFCWYVYFFCEWTKPIWLISFEMSWHT